MSIDNANRRDANRILSTALEDPDALSDRDFDDALDLLGGDQKRVRVSAAWVFGIVAAEDPGRVLPYLSAIAEYLADPRFRSEATRAIAYMTQASPNAIEHELMEIDESIARHCRNALWGQYAPRTVVETPIDHESGGAAMGRGDGDVWGWIGGTTGVYDTESEAERRDPPTDRPIDPPRVEYDYDRFTPVEPIYLGESAESFKVIYRGPNGRTYPGLFKRFRSPTDDGFRPGFDRRIRMWQSIDEHEAILPVVDWGTEPEPWVVTAYEDASGVADLGRSGQVAAAVWTLEEIAAALRYAHGRGVIHGGLTPGSVVRSSIISEPNAWRYPRLTDWGSGRLLGEGVADGSLPDRYLAPEHVDRESFGSIDGSTDVFCFGVLTFAALVGEPPNPAREADERVMSSGRPSIPTELENRLPGLERFLGRCLAARKPERFETIEAMTKAFRNTTESLDG